MKQSLYNRRLLLGVAFGFLARQAFAAAESDATESDKDIAAQFPDWLTNEKQNEVSYVRGNHNFNVYYLPELARDLNGVGVGHALAYEAMVSGNAKTLDTVTYNTIVGVLKNPPRFMPNERLVANTFSRRFGVLEQIFEQTHLLHAQTVDVLANTSRTTVQKEQEIERLYRMYATTLPYAVTALPLNMGFLYGQSYSRRFRDRYPKTNGLFWGYHWLQGAMYDALYGKSADTQKQVYKIIGAQYRDVELYRLDWPFMPMTAEVSPRFALRFPEIANVFDNLHMLHDMVNDILASTDMTRKQQDDAVRLAIWRVMAAAHRGYSPGDAPEPGKWRDYRFMEGMPGMGQMPDMPLNAMYMRGLGWMKPAACHHCSLPVTVPPSQSCTVTADGWTMRVRCPLCARDMSAETKGKAILHLSTEDPDHPLVLISDDQGNLTATDTDLGKSAVFLEVEASHGECPEWSQAFTNRVAFDNFVRSNPAYRDAIPLSLADWQQRQGKKPDTYFKQIGPPGNPFDHPNQASNRMKTGSAALVLVILLSLFSVQMRSAYAIDHDNVDASRPLRFDDAESIGLRDRAFEVGLSPLWVHGSRFGGRMSAEYLNGFALNSYYTVDFDASNRGIGRTGIGLFHNFRRETLTKPAVAVRFDTYLPTGTDTESGRGIVLRLRGIASRTVKQSDRVHINLDAIVRTASLPGMKSFRPEVTVGYTKPLGYPTRFDRTGLAELAYRTDESRGYAVSTGIGVRQQVTPRSVADIGMQSDLVTVSGATRELFRMNIGYSTSF